MTDLIKAISDIVAEPARNCADGCFAPGEIDRCDDTGCWCRDYCDDKAREIIELVREHDQVKAKTASKKRRPIHLPEGPCE